MRHIILFLLMFVFASVYADDYKILYLSTETIEIGGKEKHKGDTFSDKAVIKWTLATQSMRIKRVKGDGVKIKVVTKELMKGLKSQTVAELDKQKSSTNDYLKQNIKKNHTSTRQAISY
ncbi:MAG: hypothetical protein KBT34_09285 [Prevotella sp.]|nr:hypothetical protein [Candidatus Prevotella equi]